MSTTASSEAVREQLGLPRKPPRAETGTVVKWQELGCTFVAVFVAGQWWITGQDRGIYKKIKFGYDEFFTECLRNARTIRVATDWDEVGSRA